MEEYLPKLTTILVVALIAMIPATIGILYRLIRPYLVFKLGAEKLMLLESISMILVRAAEQMGMRMGLDGTDKKLMVIGMLDSITKALDIRIDKNLLEDLIDNMIEGSVKKLRIEETIAKNDQSPE